MCGCTSTNGLARSSHSVPPRPLGGQWRCSRRPAPRWSTSCRPSWRPTRGGCRSIVLTADRPAELRDRGAAQAIDQDHLYGRYRQVVRRGRRRRCGAPPRCLRAQRGQSRRGDRRGRTRGPVQLNLPFREPLVPIRLARGVDRPVRETCRGRWSLASVRSLALDHRRHSPVGCGAARADSSCAARSTWRISRRPWRGSLPPPASRCWLTHSRTSATAHHDRAARHHALRGAAAFDDVRAAHVPEVVLRFGTMPTSKALVESLQAWAAPQIVIDDGGWAETTLLPVTTVHAAADHDGQHLSDLAGGRAEAVRRSLAGRMAHSG